MAKDRKAAQRRKPVQHELPLKKTNYQILASALVCIVLGYIALSQKPWDGFFPLVIAPILLFIGYCVLVPLGILFRKRGEESSAGEASPPNASQ